MLRHSSGIPSADFQLEDLRGFYELFKKRQLWALRDRELYIYIYAIYSAGPDIYIEWVSKGGS